MEAGRVGKSDPSEKPWSGAWPPAATGHQQPALQGRTQDMGLGKERPGLQEGWN